MHAQTLRTYDRLGLVSPQRSSGGGRRYSQHDVDLLREVQRLSQDEGVNLAGIKRIIELTNQVEALQSRLPEMAEELDAVARQRSVAMSRWCRRARRWWSGSRAARRDASRVQSSGSTLIENRASPACPRARSGSRRGAVRRSARPSARSTMTSSLRGREELRGRVALLELAPRSGGRRRTARTPHRRAPCRSRRRTRLSPSGSVVAGPVLVTRRSGCPSRRRAGGACFGVSSCPLLARHVRDLQVRVVAEAQRHRRRRRSA